MTDEEFYCSLETLLDEVEARWQRQYPVPPETVYHYTSSHGFSGIVRSRRLWATVSSQLNDMQELTHAADTLRATLGRHAGSAARPLSQLLYRPEVLNMDYARADVATGFVASLSGSEDDLPQWCMYADHFYGLALAFDSHSLVELDRANDLTQGMGFFGVSYSHEEQEEFFEWLVSRWEREAGTAVARHLLSANDPRMFLAWWSAILATVTITVLPRMKSRHFRAENEWRLTHMHLPNLSCCAVHESNSKIHVELDLTQVGAFPLKSVWLGPGVANDESKAVVRRFLDAHHFEHVPVELSKIPLRASQRVLTLGS